MGFIAKHFGVVPDQRTTDFLFTALAKCWQNYQSTRLSEIERRYAMLETI